MSNSNSKSLKWLSIFFVIHFIADITFAIPLMISPERLLKLIGWTVVDPFAARLVAAALFGIGIESLIGRHSSIDSFKGMLNLKIIWSFAAIISFIIAIFSNIETVPFGIYFALLVFVCFNALWVYWRIKLNKLTHE